MPRITVPEEEWTKLLRDMKELKANSKREEIAEHEKGSQNLDLSDIEKAVLKFIKEHPGTSK